MIPQRQLLFTRFDNKCGQTESYNTKVLKTLPYRGKFYERHDLKWCDLTNNYRETTVLWWYWRRKRIKDS